MNPKKPAQEDDFQTRGWLMINSIINSHCGATSEQDEKKSSILPNPARSERSHPIRCVFKVGQVKKQDGSLSAKEKCWASGTRARFLEFQSPLIDGDAMYACMQIWIGDTTRKPTHIHTLSHWSTHTYALVLYRHDSLFNHRLQLWSGTLSRLGLASRECPVRVFHMQVRIRKSQKENARRKCWLFECIE